MESEPPIRPGYTRDRPMEEAHYAETVEETELEGQLEFNYPVLAAAGVFFTCLLLPIAIILWRIAL